MKIYIYLLNILFLYSSCNSSGLIKISSEKSNPDSTLHLTIMTSKTVLTPMIQIKGVKSGSLIRLFTDANCTFEVASAYASNSSIDLTSTPLTPGRYNFYANSTDQDCSTSSASLTLISAPSLSFVNASELVGTPITISPAIYEDHFSSVTSCTVTPPLPSGLSINDTSCVISGSLQSASPLTTYTVTARNEAGSISTQINLEVASTQPLQSAPSISYSPSSVGSIGTSLSINPTFLLTNGAAITDCTISPTLPNTLSIDQSTCVISGTPIAVLSSTPYTVTISNSRGSSTATLNLLIAASPPIISYSGATGTTGRTSHPMTVSPTTMDTRGAPLSSCSVSPPLPTGLVINSSTCVISGTPIVVRGANSYAVTATNSAGSASATLSFAVSDGTPGTPTSIALSGDISPTIDTTPTFEIGGVASGYIVKLYTDSNCSTQVASAVASGTTVLLTSSVLTTGSKSLYATASTGNPLLTSPCSTTTSTITIHAAPTISYATSQGTSGLVGEAMNISPSALMHNGSAITSCTVTPVLPSTLDLNSTTCSIVGTPTAVLSSTAFTITATNAAGSSTTVVSLSVLPNRPSISYPSSPATSGIVDVLHKVSPSALNARGAPITSCVISPALPSGFSIHNSTCAITGTPETVMPDTTYSVSVSNSVGSTTVNLILRVLVNPCPTNYLYIQSNILAGTTAPFCVAKYEMKLVAGIATSQPANAPENYISLIDSKMRCEGLNSYNGVSNKYDLISNQEWQTIALDVEKQDANWTGNIVGSGMMYVGHSDGNPNLGLAVDNVSNSWNNTNSASTDPVTLGHEQRRTLKLSTGQTIWDFSGNLWEWVNWTTGGNVTAGPATCSGNWTEFPLVSCAELSPMDYMPGNPANISQATYNSIYGVGAFYGGTGSAARRGGGYYNRIDRVGPFSLDLDYTLSRTLVHSGYRCVFRP